MTNFISNANVNPPPCNPLPRLRSGGRFSDYIIMTNFDFYWGDVREWFDPTGGNGMFHPRRVAAQKYIEENSVEGAVTDDVLWGALDDKGTFADTVFQGVFNVEKRENSLTVPDIY